MEQLYIQHSQEGDYRHVTVHTEEGLLVAQAHVYEKKQHVWFDGVVVADDYRRRGIATTLYCYAEEVAGKPVRQSKECTPSSRALWKQGNRPFGRKT
jgi:N-acetylglutamate synthase-like GNAT family acetyltransferase